MVDVLRERLMIHPLQLVGEIALGTQRSLVSQHLTFAYSLEEIRVRFPLGAANRVRVYLFLSFDPSSPTTALPAGTPLLS